MAFAFCAPDRPLKPATALINRVSKSRRRGQRTSNCRGAGNLLVLPQQLSSWRSRRTPTESKSSPTLHDCDNARDRNQDRRPHRHASHGPSPFARGQPSAALSTARCLSPVNPRRRFQDRETIVRGLASKGTPRHIGREASAPSSLQALRSEVRHSPRSADKQHKRRNIPECEDRKVSLPLHRVVLGNAEASA